MKFEEINQKIQAKERRLKRYPILRQAIQAKYDIPK